MVDDIDAVFQAARLVTRRRYPGLSVTAITLTLSNNEIARLPVPDLLASLQDKPEGEMMNQPEEIPESQRFTWSQDYTAVNWYGRKYQFTPAQRPIIAALIEAMRNGTPALSIATLLEIAESEGKRLRDIFRKHPAWQQLIVNASLHGGPIDAYQINPGHPDEE